MKIRLLAAAALTVAALCCCSTSAEKTKTLVLYYSQTGATKAVAEALQSQLGADIASIEAVEPYDTDYAATVARWCQEREAGVKVAIQPLAVNLDRYDTIFLGFPVWGGTVASPVETFLADNSLAGKTVVTFATFGSGGLDSATADVATAQPDATVVKGYGVRNARVEKAPAEIARFLIEGGYVEGEIDEDYIQPGPAVIVDSTQRGLRLYYPRSDSVDLRCFERPIPEVDSTIIFCCAAAYTGVDKINYKHKNIAGDHVSNGTRFGGYRCDRNSGAFVFYDKKWKFLHNNYTHELDSAALYGGMGFGQELLIFNGTRLKTTRPDENVNLFRALCEIDGQLCIADATDRMAFGDFKQALLDADVSNAIYTDMGEGWNYSWYREYQDSAAIYIHQSYKKAATNWIVFYRNNDI